MDAFAGQEKHPWRLFVGPIVDRSEMPIVVPSHIPDDELCGPAALAPNVQTSGFKAGLKVGSASRVAQIHGMNSLERNAFKQEFDHVLVEEPLVVGRTYLLLVQNPPKVW